MGLRLSKVETISAIFFTALIIWWLLLQLIVGNGAESASLVWAATYQLMAWFGGIFGLISAHSWGGAKSRMGRTILYFSIGLLLQGFGQSAFSFYNIVLHVDIPYPSIADAGYFASVIFYILGIVSLARISGASFKMKDLKGKILAFILLVLMLIASKLLFLADYDFDWSAPLRTFLDLGYPLGEAFYVSIAMLALYFSRNMLGGVMRTPLIIMMFALLAQYAAEFNFLTQALNGTWVNGGYGDILYLLSYFVMTVSLIRISTAIKH